MTLAAPFFENAGVLAVIAAFPVVFAAWLVYKQSVKSDKITAEAGISTLQSQSLQQAFDQNQKHIDNLQKDNALLRERIALAEKRIDELIAEIAAIQKQLRANTH